MRKENKQNLLIMVIGCLLLTGCNANYISELKAKNIVLNVVSIN